jgi:NAD(P)H-dependent FMN reductase
LVSVLKQIHDELDAAVFAAYGWGSTGSPRGLSDEQILEKLVALNAERAVEEKRGLIRWLRPEYQNKAGGGTQTHMDLPQVRPVKGKKVKATKQAWPAAMAEQAKALRAVLSGLAAPQTPTDIAKAFKRANVERIEELLETLVSLGQARKADGDRYGA